MKVSSPLKADELRVAQITVNYLQDPVKIEVLAGLVHNKSGRTLAWSKEAEWSSETRDLLNKLRESMEADFARTLFGVDGVAKRTESGVKLEGGIGEHLGDGSDAPQV
jgi:hypothetical protein